MTTTTSAARLALTVAAAATLAAIAAPAQAALTIYTAPAAFNAATLQRFTDSYADLAIDFAGSPLTRQVANYSYTATVDGGLYGAGSAADVWLSTNLSNAAITFGDFTGGVRGLGAMFFGSDAAGAFVAGETITLTATDSLGATVSTTLLATTPTVFVGFVSDALLTSVTAGTDAVGSVWVTVNDLVLSQAPGAPIPEPGTWALMAAGLATVVSRIRRSRTRD